MVLAMALRKILNAAPSALTRKLVTFSSILSILMVSSLSAQADATKATPTPSASTKQHYISLWGEPKYPADFKQFDYTSANAKKGGAMRYYYPGSFDSLNPFLEKGEPAEHTLEFLYATLGASSMDEVGVIYGFVAEHFEIANDNSWVVFHINPKARFSDGTAITADDVVWSYNTLIEKAAPTFAIYFADAGDATALDKTRVKINIRNPANHEVAIILASVPIFPKHFWEKHDFQKDTLVLPVTSGPYNVKKIDGGRHIAYERVKNWWAEDLPSQKGFYNFDDVTVDYYRDFDVAHEAFKAGEFDVKRENISKLWNTGYDIPAVKNGQLKQALIPDGTPQYAQGYFFNFRKPEFQDLALRKAMTYAFDFEWANKNLFYGAYSRTLSYFTNSEMASSGLPTGRELEILLPFKKQLPPSVFNEKYSLPTTDGSGRDRKPLIQAKKILDKAGYISKDGKLISPITNSAIDIEFITYDASSERILAPYLTNLQKLGINATMRRIDTSHWVKRVQDYDFDITTLSFIPPLSPGNEQRDYWHSEAAKTKGSQNYSGLADPVVDALIELIIQTPSREELVYRVRALDRVLLHNYVIVPQWHIATHRVAYWDKFDMPTTLPKYDPRFKLTMFTWWYNEDKAKKLK